MAKLFHPRFDFRQSFFDQLLHIATARSLPAVALDFFGSDIPARQGDDAVDKGRLR